VATANAPEFTMHNIRLDDGAQTKPGAVSMEAHPVFVATRKLLLTAFPGDKSALRIADLGCLEGGFAVEFARMGFQVLGLEVRESNLEACRYAQARVKLPNLAFVKDDAWNLAAHGAFDIVFCNGLLYHLDRPREFLGLLSAAARRCLVLNTHFAVAADAAERLPYRVQRWLGLPVSGRQKFNLSEETEHEGLPGRWFPEFATEQQFSDREALRWAAWDNRRSFWIQREYLIGALYEAGFDFVAEQFDILAPDIAQSMTRGYYRTDCRGMFVALKTAAAAPAAR